MFFFTFAFQHIFSVIFSSLFISCAHYCSVFFLSSNAQVLNHVNYSELTAIRFHTICSSPLSFFFIFNSTQWPQWRKKTSFFNQNTCCQHAVYIIFYDPHEFEIALRNHYDCNSNRMSILMAQICLKSLKLRDIDSPVRKRIREMG